MAKNIDLYMDQGADFLAILPPVTNTDGSIFDLTGYTVVCQLRRSYPSKYAVQLVSTIAEDPTTGVITLSLQNSETAGLYPLRYVYDVVITDEDDFRTKVFDGLIIVNAGVSDNPDTILLTPWVPEDFGGIF